VGDTTPKAKVTSVKVMGDSLSDSGTFGFKFTVQGSAPTGAGSTMIWPERIADQFSQSLCAHFRAGDENLTTYQEVATCTNYAVGGGRVNPLDAPTSPKSVLVQIQAASKAGFSADDLVVIDGGANDAADVIGALIAAAKGNSQPLNAMVAWLDSKAAGTSTALMTQAGGDASKFAGLAAGAYLQTLAKTLAGSIAQNVVAKGATRVAVLNVPPSPRHRASRWSWPALPRPQAAGIRGCCGRQAGSVIRCPGTGLQQPAGRQSGRPVPGGPGRFLHRVQEPDQQPGTVRLRQREGPGLPDHWRGRKRPAQLHLPHLHGSGLECHTRQIQP
jgi:hypothetical protein